VHLLFAGNLFSADTWNPIDEGKHAKRTVLRECRIMPGADG
jgi:hypothetical protein